MKKNRGFTLLEILLVVAAIAILAGIVILAINPSKQLGDTKNAQRRSDVNTILNAIYQHSIDNAGTLASTITTAPKEICQSGVATTTCTNAGMAYFGDSLYLNEKYLTGMPSDPQATTTNGTGYYVQKTGNNRVTVWAPFAEQGATISATK